MNTLAKQTKTGKLLDIFSEVGSHMKWEDVCDITEISGYNSLKALFSYIRKAPHIPDENRIDVHIRDGICIRMN